VRTKNPRDILELIESNVSTSPAALFIYSTVKVITVPLVTNTSGYSLLGPQSATMISQATEGPPIASPTVLGTIITTTTAVATSLISPTAEPPDEFIQAIIASLIND
jgi:hypothetical protein